MKSTALSALLISALAAPLAARADSGDRALNATFAQWDTRAAQVAATRPTATVAAAESYPGTIWQQAPASAPTVRQTAAPMPAPLAAGVDRGA